MISQSKKTNPILSAVGGLQMNVTSILTKDYENERFCRRGENKPNQTQFQRQKNAQALIFRTFFVIFAHFLTIFLSFSHNFSNIFERFQMFLIAFLLPILPKPYILTSQPPFWAQDLIFNEVS